MSKSKRLSIKKFVKKWNYSPFDEEKMTEVALRDLEKNTVLYNMAKELDKARSDFEDELREHGFEYG